MDYNKSQLDAIHSTVWGVSHAFAHPRICLIQGPPGTGKTHTISGVVSAVLTVRCCVILLFSSIQTMHVCSYQKASHTACSMRCC